MRVNKLLQQSVGTTVPWEQFEKVQNLSGRPLFNIKLQIIFENTEF